MNLGHPQRRVEPLEDGERVLERRPSCSAVPQLETSRPEREYSPPPLEGVDGRRMGVQRCFEYLLGGSRVALCGAQQARAPVRAEVGPAVGLTGQRRRYRAISAHVT